MMQQQQKIHQTGEISHINLFRVESALSTNHPISFNHNKRIINEIIGDIFDERRGTCDVSSSQCSSIKLKTSEYSFDKRLKYWKDVLKDRQKLQNKITKKTAKKPGEILYNRLSTIDERDKQTVKTILDYADRMRPEKLSEKRQGILPEKCEGALAELQETLAKAERDQRKSLEITGVPKAVRVEMLGKPRHQGDERLFSWLSSKVLERRVEDQRDDIERIVEFYPDIENLQVIGEGLGRRDEPKRDSDIQLIKRDQVCEISSDSHESEAQCLPQPPPLDEPKKILYGFKINEFVYLLDKKHKAKATTIELNFTSHPFGREVKKLITMQNIGQKVLNLEWSHRAYYAKNSALLKATDNEFIFDNQPFRLYQGQSKEIFVLYQPRKVDVVKSKWVLKVDPCCFCRKSDGIVMLLNGSCLPHPEYAEKLQKIQTQVIEKSNLKMMRKLTTGLGTISTQLEPIDIMCPYQRTLNDAELFEQLNPGYKCDRFHDLELLKDLHQRVKKPREKPWDLKVDSIKDAVLRVENSESRALFFHELTNILDDMKGTPMKLEERLLLNPEKKKTRHLYVRGIICTGIDEWEGINEALRASFLKATINLVRDEITDLKFREEEKAKLKAQDAADKAEEAEAAEKAATDDEPKNDHLFALLEDDFALCAYALETRVKPLKAFRDCLYMQTYTLLCDVLENIVNIIESTESI